VKLTQNFLHSSVKPVHVYGSFFAGFDEPSEKFFAVERLATAISFHHAQLGAFD
jgi:hypothetical protein